MRPPPEWEKPVQRLSKQPARQTVLNGPSRASVASMKRHPCQGRRHGEDPEGQDGAERLKGKAYTVAINVKQNGDIGGMKDKLSGMAAGAMAGLPVQAAGFAGLGYASLMRQELF